MPRSLLITVSLSFLAFPAQAQAQASPAKADRLIEQMGSGMLAQREAASKVLDAIRGRHWIP
jgi:hypothetical protein